MEVGLELREARGLLRDALVDGDTLALELEFSREGVVTVPVPVQPLSSFPR